MLHITRHAHVSRRRAADDARAGAPRRGADRRASWRAAAAWFPLVGAAVGGARRRRPTGRSMRVHLPTLAPWAALAAAIVVTGAFHEDGLADTADGLFGGRDRARRLDDHARLARRHLRRRRAGARARRAGDRASARCRRRSAWRTLVAAHALGRAAALPLTLLPYARAEGGLGASVAQRVPASALVLRAGDGRGAAGAPAVAARASPPSARPAWSRSSAPGAFSAISAASPATRSAPSSSSPSSRRTSPRRRGRRAHELTPPGPRHRRRALGQEPLRRGARSPRSRRPGRGATSPPPRRSTTRCARASRTIARVAATPGAPSRRRARSPTAFARPRRRRACSSTASPSGCRTVMLDGAGDDALLAAADEVAAAARAAAVPSSSSPTKSAAASSPRTRWHAAFATSPAGSTSASLPPCDEVFLVAAGLPLKLR